MPEIKLHLAEESLPIWQKTEEELGEMNVPPPYWAFAWAGGQALARYVLDNPSARCGKARARSGRRARGLTAIAAQLAGASAVLAVDIDPMALAAISLNAAANGVAIGDHERRSAGRPRRRGTTSFSSAISSTSAQLADRVLSFIEAAAARGAHGPGRRSAAQLFPKDRFVPWPSTRCRSRASWRTPRSRRTAVWRLPA